MTDNIVDIILGTGIVIIVTTVIAVVVRVAWHVPKPDEAVIITGRKAGRQLDDGGNALRIFLGKGVFAWPAMNRVSRISLSSHTTFLQVDCVTMQAIPVKLTGVALFKVGDDEASITNAARRFLHAQDSMEETVHEVFAGHLRAIVGQIKVEELITDRERLAELTRRNSSDEIQKLGLVVDSLQIEHIEDSTDYNKDLERPHRAAAQMLAIEAEQRARVSNAKAEETGSIAEEEKRQRVLVQETESAKLEALREDSLLEIKVRKPADAQKYKKVVEAQAGAEEVRLLAQARAEATLIEAEAEAKRIALVGEANAEATRKQGLAEAEVIQARAEALSINSSAVLSQELAENWVDVVRVAAAAVANADQLIVLNGAEGISQLIAQTMAQGAQGLGLARKMFAAVAEEQTDGRHKRG